MFKESFSFEGRIRRTEFVISYLIFIASVIVLTICEESCTDVAKIAILGYIPLLWFVCAQGSKRCHDRGNSGWFQIIPFYALWMLFADSDFGDNEYGPNPKGIENTKEIDKIGNHLAG